MNICFPMIGNKIGGSDISTITLASCLKKKKKVKVIILLHNKGKLEKIINDKKLDYTIFKKSMLRTNNLHKIMFYIIRNFYHAYTFLKRNKIDIVHTNDNFTSMFWSVVSFLAGCKVVWHKRNTDTSKKLLAMSIFVDKIVTISKFVESYLPEILKKKSSLIYNPFHIKNNKVHKSSKKSYTIGYFSNFSHRKRTIFFVDFVNKLIKSNKRYNFSILMYGDGEKSFIFDLKKRIEDYKIKKFFLIKSFAEKPELYMKRCNLIVCPAVDEPFGRVLVESIILNIPVLAAKSGGHLEIINQDADYLARPDDLYDFANKAMKILLKKNSNFLSLKKRVSKKFSHIIHEKEMLKLYQELIK